MHEYDASWWFPADVAGGKSGRTVGDGEEYTLWSRNSAAPSLRSPPSALSSEKKKGLVVVHLC